MAETIAEPYTTDLDIVIHEGESLAVVCSQIADRFGLRWTVVDEFGPGGGAAVVRFSGAELAVGQLEGWYEDGGEL